MNVRMRVSLQPSSDIRTVAVKRNSTKQKKKPYLKPHSWQVGKLKSLRILISTWRVSWMTMNMIEIMYQTRFEGATDALGAQHYKTIEKYCCQSKAHPSNRGHKNQQRNPGQQLTYEFCPLPHHLPIHCLLLKHFCLHPLLPEPHGQSQTSEDIYQDSTYKMYCHCKNNNLCNIWAYLWTNWYSPAKWGLWA